MADRPKVLTKQVVVRLTPTLRRALEQDAAEHGRTVAQSIRYHLARALYVEESSP